MPIELVREAVLVNGASLLVRSAACGVDPNDEQKRERYCVVIEGHRAENPVLHYEDQIETAMQAVVFHGWGLIKEWKERP